MATTDAVVRPKPPVIAVKSPGAPVARSKAWSGEDRYRMIAEAAYFRAERHGFSSGRELSDWLAAEIEVDEILGDGGPR